MANVINTPAPTLQQLIEAEKTLRMENEALKAQLADSKAKMKIEAAVSDYSKGTVSIRGINRFPLSLFPPQIAAVTEYLNSAEFKTWLNSPDTQDKLRCAAAAHEFAAGLGFAYPSDKKSPTFEADLTNYTGAYNKAYQLAKADKSIVATGKVKSSASSATTVVR